MTDNFPLLTVDNVYQWYWYNEPKYSMKDVAKEVGCGASTIHRFMEKHDIPRRSLSAALNISWTTEGKRVHRYEQWELLTVENILNWYWNSDPKWSLNDIAQKIKCSDQTVLDFLRDNKIPRRDYIEASKVMHSCPSKSLKRKKYPLLTYKNVNHWYWEIDPPLSTSDIAERVGCSQSNVSKFMRENDIPRRSDKDAALNIFRFPTKKKNYKISDMAKKNLSRVMKEKERISERQSLILQELQKHKIMFIADLVEVPHFKGKITTRILRQSTYLLFKRKLVNRVLDYNPSSKPNCHNQYKYSITSKGSEVLAKLLD
jgi:predicted DNA-binding protein YlxM (UPF0122 family)